MTFEIIHKPTFLHQLLAIPKEFLAQILEKVETLRSDPSPHGKTKKKLHGYKGDIYRLRSGDYRIIYTYGDGWVMILGVDNRKDVYKGSKLVAETTTLNVKTLPDPSDLLTLTATTVPNPAATTPTTATPTYLPRIIDTELLQQLRVPPEYHPILTACKTLDDLITADIPEAVRELVFDAVEIPDFDQVLNQPSYVTGTPDELLRFQQGDLVGFLLKLNAEQEKFVTWSTNASGPTLLKGGPGTGKSTVAIYRTREILKQLQVSDTANPKILYTTYTNALVTFSQQLLHQLLGDDIQFVDVQTADSLMHRLVKQSPGQSPQIATDSTLKTALKTIVPEAIAHLQGNILQQQAQRIILQRLTPEYLLEEINNVIDAREITTLTDYQATPRNGRNVPLNKIQRQAVWEVRSRLHQFLADANKETWAQKRNRALHHLRTMENPPIYDAVIVDEAQDLPPNTLRFLIQLCRAPNRLFITADANQSIYGSSFRWADVHQDLKFVGRTGILRLNHRTTREIGEAAHQYLQFTPDDGADRSADTSMLDVDAVKVDTQSPLQADPRHYIHTGPPPAVRAITNSGDQAKLLAHFCRTATREFRLGIGSCAILTPSERSGKDIAGQLQNLGIDAQFMASKELDLQRQGVKVLTLKAAKGLEFPIVAIAGFLGSRFPYIPKGSTSEAQAELLNQERRTLYVAMTRAMRALLIVVPAQNPSHLLQGFDDTIWNLRSEAA